MQKQKRDSVRAMAVTAMLGAVASVLMFFDFPIPFIIPSFIKFDISELPALLASFSFGPVHGVAVCIIKNLIHVLIKNSTMGIGELSNLCLGICFVVPAGLIYKYHKSRKMAVIGAAVGAVIMAIMSVPINYFVTYPMYIKMYADFGGWEAILAMYQAILPGAKSLIQVLLIFNMPFTFFKGAIVAVLTFFIYKPLSPILHGRNK